MLTKEIILETLRRNKPYFEKELGVLRIGLFGSYAKEFHQPESDVDILVELKPPLADNYFTLWVKLEKELKNKVDLVRKGDHLSEKFLQTVEREIIYA
jgi:predicted nucleotidyltransferase